MPMLRAPLSGELLPTLFPKGGARAHDVEQCRQGCDGRLGPGVANDAFLNLATLVSPGLFHRRLYQRQAAVVFFARQDAVHRHFNLC